MQRIWPGVYQYFCVCAKLCSCTRGLCCDSFQKDCRDLTYWLPKCICSR